MRKCGGATTSSADLHVKAAATKRERTTTTNEPLLTFRKRVRMTHFIKSPYSLFSNKAVTGCWGDFLPLIELVHRKLNNTNNDNNNSNSNTNPNAH